MNRLPRSPHVLVGPLVAAAMMLLGACSDAPMSVYSVERMDAKGGPKPSTTDPIVASVDPAYGQQGDVNKKVRVFGSGFENGARVEFVLDGVPDETRVKTNNTAYISSSELEVDITIAADAKLDLYDVTVTAVSGKKGIGTEMFEITTAESIGTLGGNTLSNGINDAGQVVGYSIYGNVQHAFLWEQGIGMQSLGPGNAHDVGDDGTVVGNSGGNPVIWTRVNGVWLVPQQLPTSGEGGAANAVASDASGSAILIAGSNSEKVGKATNGYAAIWERVGESWVRRSRLPTPDGYFSWATDVNHNGQAVGAIRKLSGSTLIQASVWEPVNGIYQRTTLASLPGATRSGAQGVNAQGDMAVGMSDGLPVFWRKSGGVWGEAERLPLGTGTCTGADQWAMDVNSRGWIVGRTCNGTGWRATLWRGPGAPREDLGALGYGKDTSAANAISDAVSPVIAGNSPGSKTREGVIWRNLIISPQ